MAAPRVYRFFTARDGRRFLVREAEPADARQTLAHTRAVLAEPEWNITELREFDLTLEEERSWIREFRETPHSILLVADFGTPAMPHIVGIVHLMAQHRFRTRHRARLGISVQAPYRGIGVGEALLTALLDWAAAEPELERIELSVFAHNQRAINLYRKLGFVEEARLAKAYKLADNTYYDDVLMVKWVKP